MEVYLIRHAQSTNQVLDGGEGAVFDPPLTDVGQRQTRLLAEYFRAGRERVRFVESGIDRLACSPMWRALETAQPLSETLHLTPEVWIDVHEQVFTADVQSGRTREEILAAFPRYRLPDQITDRGWWRRGEEKRSSLVRRARGVAADLRRQAHLDEALAIVSHARFLDSLLKALLQIRAGHRVWFHHSNTAVSRVALTNGSVEVRYINRVAHLPPPMVT